jgi:transcription-repair coupling factor (superfamily II helicase)
MELDNLIHQLGETDKYKSFISSLSVKNPFKISGLTNGAKCLWMTPLLKDKNKTFLIVCSTKEEEDFFQTFFQYVDLDYEVFPSLEISPYEHIQTDINTVNKQYQVIENILNKRTKVVLTKTKALNQKMMSLNDLKKNIFTIRKSQIISPLNLTEELVRLGYKPNSILEKRGEFSRKGGNVSIYPVGYDNPIKIEWFDDDIESIKEYDIETQKTKDSIDLVTLYPVSKIAIPHNFNNKINEEIMQNLMVQIVKIYSKGLTRNAEELRKKVENSLINIKNFEYDDMLYTYFNYIYSEEASLLDYFPENTIMMWTEFTSQNSSLKKIEETFKTPLEDKYSKGILFETKGDLYINLNDILKKSRNFSQIRFSSLTDMPNINLQFSGTLLPAFSTTNKFDDLVSSIRTWSQHENKNILVVSAQPQRALTILRERDCNAIYGENPDLNQKGIVWVLRGELTKGFSYPDLNLIFITDSELFGWTQKQVKKKSKEKKDTGLKIAKIQDIKIDDFVVHELHGIGQYKGLRTVELEGKKREYFEIIYAKKINYLYLLNK